MSCRMKDKVVKVIFYLASGKEFEMQFTQEQFDDLIEKLSLGWNKCSSTGPFIGVNFSLVAAYQVINE